MLLADLNRAFDERQRAAEACPIRRDLQSCKVLLEIATGRFDSTWRKGVRPDRFFVKEGLVVVSDGYRAGQCALPSRLRAIMSALSKSDIPLSTIIATRATSTRFNEFVANYRRTK